MKFSSRFLNPVYLFAAVLVLFFSGCAEFDRAAVNLNPFRNPTGPAKIVIDLGKQKAMLYRGGELADVSRISSGREGYDTPAGKFTVIEKDIDHRSSLYGAFVSNSTDLIVVPDVDTRKKKAPSGTHYVGAPMFYFLRFQGAHGLHASEDVPNRPASHGCIRLPKSAAKKFYSAAKIGTSVIVIR